MKVHRSQLIAVYEKVLDKVSHDKKSRATGQFSFFDTLEIKEDKVEIPNIEEYSTIEKLAKEKEVAGIYLTGHPLDDYADHLKAYTHNTSMFKVQNEEEESEEEVMLEVADGDDVEIGGMIIEAGKRQSKKTGKDFGIGKLEDLYGTVDLMLSGYKLNQYKDIFVKDKLVTVKGKLRLKSEGATVAVDFMSDWNNVTADVKAKKICVYYSFEQKGKEITPILRNIFSAYKGKDETYVKNLDDGKLYALGIKTEIGDVMVRELYGLVGAHNIKIIE